MGKGRLIYPAPREFAHYAEFNNGELLAWQRHHAPLVIAISASFCKLERAKGISIFFSLWPAGQRADEKRWFSGKPVEKLRDLFDKGPLDQDGRGSFPTQSVSKR